MSEQPMCTKCFMPMIAVGAQCSGGKPTVIAECIGCKKRAVITEEGEQLHENPNSSEIKED